jgi:hypothetical protein
MRALLNDPTLTIMLIGVAVAGVVAALVRVLSLLNWRAGFETGWLKGLSRRGNLLPRYSGRATYVSIHADASNSIIPNPLPLPVPMVNGGLQPPEVRRERH